MTQDHPFLMLWTVVEQLLMHTVQSQWRNAASLVSRVHIHCSPFDSSAWPNQSQSNKYRCHFANRSQLKYSTTNHQYLNLKINNQKVSPSDSCKLLTIIWLYVTVYMAHLVHGLDATDHLFTQHQYSLKCKLAPTISEKFFQRRSQ